MKYECSTSMKLVRQSRIFGETNEFGLVAPPPLYSSKSTTQSTQKAVTSRELSK
jgi:hypothetical protein